MILAVPYGRTTVALRRGERKEIEVQAEYQADREAAEARRVGATDVTIEKMA